MYWMNETYGIALNNNNKRDNMPRNRNDSIVKWKQNSGTDLPLKSFEFLLDSYMNPHYLSLRVYFIKDKILLIC